MPFDCCWPSRNWSVEYIDTVLQINTNDSCGLVLQWPGAVILLASACKNLDDKSIWENVSALCCRDFMEFLSGYGRTVFGMSSAHPT